MVSFPKKFIIAVLVAAFAVAPFRVDAQIGRVPVLLPGEAPDPFIGGLENIGSLMGITCATSSSVAEQAGSVLTRSLSALGDSTVLIADLQKQITTVDGAIACWSGLVSRTGGIGSTTLMSLTSSTASSQNALGQIAVLKDVRKQLEARLQVASQSFWKAVLIGLLLKQTDKLAENLVNDMTEKFKIQKYGDYISAVSSTVNTNDMILRYVDNDKDRAIVRSMITNPTLRNGIHPAILAAADAYQGFDPDTMRYDDPDFFKNIGRMASSEEYKYQYQSSMVSKTDEIIAKAREAAMAEVQQSGGYKSTLNNCGPSIAAQKQKDEQYKAILDEIRDRENLRKEIGSAPKPSAKEVALINRDVKAAHSKLLNFTDTLGAAVYHICEGTNTPATKFKDTIHDLIGSQIKNFSDYNDNNLPLFQKLVVDLANNLVNKFVFGSYNTTNGDLLNETLRSVTTGVSGTLSQPSNGVPPIDPQGSVPLGNIIVYAYDPAVPNGDRLSALTPGKNYVLVVDFVELATANPYKIKIDGGASSVTPINRALTTSEQGNERVTINYRATSSPLTLSVMLYVKDAAGADKVIGSIIKNFTVGGEVQGVSVFNSPRGPVGSFR